MTNTINLSAEQALQLRDTNTQQALAVANAADFGAISNSQFVFFSAFDGTNNDLFSDSQKTNVAQLTSQVEDARNANVLARYYPGPGARGTLVFSSWLPPQVTLQVSKQAQKAYNQFAALARTRLEANSATLITAAIASFSRGGASAAIFTQLLYANGLFDSEGHVLIAPGQIKVSAGLLFDPVLTGVSGNMAFAPNVTNVVDILARDEYRQLFKAADYRVQPDIVTIIPMFGAHSDIGGAYDNGIGAITLQAATDFFRASGLAIAPVPPSRQYAGEIILHSEADSWTEYASFQSTDLSQNPRQYDSVATPATAAMLQGRPGKELLLFDGRTITITELDGAGIEKVKLDSVATNNTERHEIDTYRIADGSTSLVDETRIVKNRRIDSQRIEAQFFETSGMLDVYVPTAHSTVLSITGGDSTPKAGTLIFGEDPSGYRFQGGTFERDGVSSISIWRDEANGITYKLQGGTLDDGQGSLVITGAPLGGAGNTLTIQNFVDGTLGISFEDKQGIDISSTSTKLDEGGLTTVTLDSHSISDKPRVVKVLASNFQGNVGGVLGDEIRPFAGGELELILPAGQSAITFGLLEQGDIDTSGTLDLTATLLNPDGTPAAADTLTFAVDATVEATDPPVTTRDILGGYPDGTDDLGNHFTGTFDPNRDDILSDSSGNDHVTVGGGIDAVFASQGGDDWIEMGTGGDSADAGPGNDLVAGGDGVDFLFGGAGDDRLFADAVVDPDAMITAGLSAPDAGPGGDFLSGNEGADLLVANDLANILEGGSGDDRIVAGGGDDTIETDGDIRGLTLGESFTVTAFSTTDADGSAVGTITISGTASRFAVDAPGDDLVHAGGGNDFVLAGAGDDVVYGEDDADHLFGEGGQDAIFGGDGNDVLSGDNGGSALDYAAHGADFLDGGGGDDTLYGDGGSDVLYGGDGNDALIGDSSPTNAGDDYLSGEAGDDQLEGGMGQDTLLGGDGADTLIGDNGGADTSGNADFLDGGAGDDTLLGQGGNDILAGGDGADFLQGDDGADTLDGGAGADILLGGAGEDALDGGDGNDVIAGDNGGTEFAGDADFISGGAGDDTLAGQGGDDLILGGDGSDTVDGGDGNDVLEGDAGDDTLQGNAGDDSLYGDDGIDTLLGGQGQDAIYGGEGNDILVGDDGVTDVLGDADIIDGGAGDDQIFGQVGDDVLAGKDGDDALDGGDGNDQLDGGAGGDRLAGGAGDDSLDGGNGIDWLDGGAGDDTLAGGDGADFYSYSFLDGGVDHLDDTGSNTLYLHGTSPVALQLTLGSLVLTSGDPANQIHLDNFDLDDVAAGAGVDAFVFDDGTTLNYEQLIALGFDIGGTPDADFLEGTSADDTIGALGGDDFVIAKAGDDSVDLGSGNDIASGGLGNDTLFGNTGDDQLSGDEGNDTLDGGEGADMLAGGAGDDAYVVDAADQVVEDVDAGTDTVQANIDYALPGNVEKLFLLGTGNLAGTGNELDNVITGNAGDNLLSGLDGNDVLEGSGGADSLDGGAGNDSLIGSNGADLLDGGADADTMHGEGGDDLYIVDDAGDAVVEQDLWLYDSFSGTSTVERMGHDTVKSSISFELPRFVEDLILTGTADIDGTGSAEQNHIEGNDGANELVSTRLDGQTDNLVSGLGAVFYLGPLPTGLDERLWDRVLARYFLGEVTSDELDAIGGNIDVGANAGDTLVGNGGNDRLIGGWDHDELDGGAGNDFLVGSGGHDVMAGGEGDDAYVVDGAFDYGFGYSNTAFVHYQDESFDEVIEDADAGVDTVYSNLEEYWLGDNVENLVLLDARDFAALGLSTGDGLLSGGAALYGYGNELDNVITGNAYNNELYGGEGNDSLSGREGDDYLDGDAGADTMSGGIGNDEYHVEDPGDRVVENALPGYDTVDSDIDYTLTANVEELYLGGATYYEDLSGTGNELDNAIYGNFGDNVLSGLEGDDELQGGLGADAMAGGGGNDRYGVDDEGDTTLENADEGHDVVSSSVTHTLGANIEDLELLDVDAFGNYVGAIDGTGNDIANQITGNESDNVLSGLGGDDALLGGEGWDTLYGGEGNDTLDGGEHEDVLVGGTGDDLYVADSYDDLVIEAAGEGTDEVLSSDSFELPDNVENLTLLGDYAEGGSVPYLDGSGNALDNVIVGNDGFNGLQGREGNDRIDGRAGGDYLSGDEGDDDLYGGDDAIFVGTAERGVFGEDGRPIKQPNGYGVLEVLASNSDFIYGGEGSDRVDGGPGDDWLYGEEGDDVIYGGDDGLSVDAERGTTDAGGETGGGWRVENGRLFLTNDDQLYGGDGNDVLDGGPGNDELYGGDGMDSMTGGTGDDTFSLDGTFVVEPRDVIDDCGELIAGVPTRMWTTDTVLENAGEGYDAIIAFAEITLPDNVEALYLQEGTYLQFAAGNAGGNAIFGNSNDNLLRGGAGDDALYGGSGDDTLDGGAGDDTLYGQAGNDIYDFGAGGGRDVVYNYGGGFDFVHLSQSVAPDAVTLSTNGSDVTIGIDGTSDRLTLAGWFDDPSGHVREIEFCDGTVLEEADISALASQHTLRAGDDFASVPEDGPPATGNLLANDSSDGISLSVADPGTYAGQFGALVVDADGSYAYTPGEVQWLAEGESRTETFGYEAQDEANAHDGATLAIDIFGQNDAPQFSADSGAGHVTEDLAVIEIDELGNELFNGGFEDFTLYSGWTVNGETGYTGVTDGPAGAVAYFGAIGDETLLSQDISTSEGEDLFVRFRLLGGASQDASFSASWNGVVLTALQNVVLLDYTDFVYEVSGAEGSSHVEFALRNDPDFWYLDDVEVVPFERYELVPGFQSTEGILDFTDVDYSDWHLVASVEPEGADYLGEFLADLAVDSTWGESGTVSWSFEVANEDLQFLSEGETLTQAYDVTLADGLGGSATRSVSVLLHGANDAPFADDDQAFVQEDNAIEASGNVLPNDGDIDAADTLSVSNPGTYQGTYGTLVLAADGAYAYTLDNATVDYLRYGDRLEESFAYDIVDSAALNPLTAGATLTVFIDGANDAPIVVNPIADQNADAGAAFTFSFAGDAFADIDQGDVLGYTAMLLDGTALPDWLTFDPAARAFAGTAPNHCDADSLTLRVTATDSWAASAFDDFTLAIAGGTGSGQHITGTDVDDVLAGTPCDDVIDGGKGYDVMAGGDGDDVYYVDRTCPAKDKVDLVVEQADEGYDIVHASADYALPDNVEELRLTGSADLNGGGNTLDNVLAGNGGDNVLAGGLGADTYVHELHGGDDVIEETGGEGDALALGAGISPDMVSLSRRNDDLVVAIAGAHDSVTVKGWFASASKRVESIGFANGTQWAVQDIQASVQQQPGCPPPSEPPRSDRDHRGDDRGERRSSDDRDYREKNERDRVAEIIDARLHRAPKFDFECAAQGQRAQDEQEIASRWRQVAGYSDSLGAQDDDGRESASLALSHSLFFDNNRHAADFGFEGSIGAPRGPQDLKGFRGLGEGFRRL